MRRAARRRSLSGAAGLALAAAGLCGCPLLNSSSDAGAYDAGTQTIGDQCTQVYTTLCDYAINQCAVSTDLQSCIAANMAHCPCTGGGCDATSPQAPSQVGICQQEIQMEDCNDVVNNTVPPDCAPFTTP